MSNFVINSTAGDSAGPRDTGATSILNTSNNFQRVNQAVPHNAAVVATTAPGTTPGDVTLASGTFVYTDILAIDLLCTVNALNANTLVPQVYVKLVDAHGSSHDLVIPLVPGQIFTWVNPSITIPGIGNNGVDANGNTFTLEGGAAVIAPTALAANVVTITCTPDKYSDVQITGTIELAV